MACRTERPHNGGWWPAQTTAIPNGSYRVDRKADSMAGSRGRVSTPIPWTEVES
jgi:hypothetical protein